MILTFLPGAIITLKNIVTIAVLVYNYVSLILGNIHLK